MASEKVYRVYFTETVNRVVTVRATSAEAAREAWDDLDGDDGKWLSSEFEVTEVTEVTEGNR